MPFSWFTADEAYGQNPGLRDWLEEQQIAYVMAVPVSEPCATAAGKIRAGAACGPPFSPHRTYSPPGLITGRNGREMITLTTADARRQFHHAATRAAPGQDHHQHWSDWRRAHQATARRCHYNRRLKDHRRSP